MRTSFLGETLAKESRAYGFTIAFWGSGAILTKAHGLPTLNEALLYGGGAVMGFGLLTLLVYRNPLTSVEYERSNMVVLTMIHYISALVPLIAASYMSKMDPYRSFFLTGLFASVLYNLGMVVEELVDEKIADLI